MTDLAHHGPISVMPKILIQCQSSCTKSLDELHEFQGELKYLPEENYQKFKSDVLELGFNSPFNIWFNPDDEKWYITDGHQRKTGLIRMRDQEGYEVPEVPCSIVHARDYRTAKKIVLAQTSQFGVMTQAGLHSFMVDADLGLSDILNMTALPQVDMNQFQKDYFPDDPFSTTVGEHERKLAEGAKELREEDFQEFEHTCPKCKFEFNSP